MHGLDLEQPALALASTKLIIARETERVDQVLRLMLESGFRRIPVTSEKGELKGLVTAVDLLAWLLQPEAKKLSMPVSNVMRANVKCLEAGDSVRTALQRFRQHKHGAYPVLEQGRLVGILSERDFLRIFPEGLKAIRVSQIAQPAIIARSHWAIADVARAMVRSGYRRLPVIEKGIPIGMVTPTDILAYGLERGLPERLGQDFGEIAKVMQKKVVSIRAEQSLDEAIGLMEEKRLGGLVVTEHDDLAGIITERDILDLLMWGLRQ